MTSTERAIDIRTMPARMSGPALIAVGLLTLYLPTLFTLYRAYWRFDNHAHGPIMLAVALWLLYRDRQHILAAATSAGRPLGSACFVAGLLAYFLGRTQGIIQFEVGSLLLVCAGLLVRFAGLGALRRALLPFILLCFMIPVPGIVAQALTLPLKSAVSTVAAEVLYAAGLPVARAGVVIAVGNYQLLVADACSGLQSLFSLEALGLVYMSLMGYASTGRNLTLAFLILPISFIANTLRVIILILVTYRFGDEAGQGFLHRFAGILLFVVATVLMLLADKLLNRLPWFSSRRVKP